MGHIARGFEGSIETKRGREKDKERERSSRRFTRSLVYSPTSLSTTPIILTSRSTSARVSAAPKVLRLSPLHLSRSHFLSLSLSSNLREIIRTTKPCERRAIMRLATSRSAHFQLARGSRGEASGARRGAAGSISLCKPWRAESKRASERGRSSTRIFNREKRSTTRRN